MLEAGNFWQLIELRAEATPDREMAVDQEGRRVTFAEYRDRCEVAAAGLAATGVDDTTIVSWQLPTWIEALVLVGALRRLGATQNPILPIYREREVGFIVDQARPRLLITPSLFGGFDFATMAAALTEGTATEALVCDRSLPEGDPGALPPAPTDDMDADDAPIRWLFYTSGTTSSPKGAQHGDIAIRTAAAGMANGLQLAPDDRAALVFPLTHIGGITWLYAALGLGFTLILDQAFNPATTVDVLRRERVTQAGAGTFFHQVYLKAQEALPDGERLFPDVRTFPGGGAPKPPQMHHAMKEKLGGAGIISGYGLTEAPILTMGSVLDPDEALASSEGTAVAGVTLRLVTVEGKEAGVDEEAFDEDGWFRTGDLGRLDAAGNLTITGRIKDVIIRKGENISAKELEDLLFDHPKVAEVAVVGLPDEERGEIACAVVVPAERGDDLTLDEVSQHLGQQGLITRKLPERLELVDALPRNPAGKIVKYELRDRFTT